MSESELKSGDFLKDVEIIVHIRSGGTDLRVLEKLMKAIVASSTSLVDTKVVSTESELKVKSTSQGTLSTIIQKLFIE